VLEVVAVITGFHRTNRFFRSFEHWAVGPDAAVAQSSLDRPDRVPDLIIAGCGIVF
jgi:hypothetical protein